MELFNIVGRISAQYSEAVSDIQTVSTAADNAAEIMENLGDEAERTQEPVEGLGDETEETGEQTDDTNDSFTVWKGTLANLASEVITNVISKVTNLADEIVGLGEDFTATMSEVQAISGASDEELAELEETARKFGSTTIFSATEAAEALKYMSLAGWSADESAAALGGVLDLAAASGMGLGEASDMVTDYLSAFGMEAEQSAYFADMLAYAQANSNTTATQLGDAYGNCAATLNAAGQDVETVTALLEAMANQGLKGSEGGTALSATMRDITNSMSEVKDKTDLAQLAQNEFVSSTGDLNDLLGKNYIQMGKTLIPVSDAKGNFRDLTDIISDVSKATNGMGDAEKAAAMSNTFTTDSIKGVNLVLNEGIDKVAGYEEKLRKADGAAADMAATMNDNLTGDLANMNSAFEELKLKIFDGLEKPLRSVSQFVTNKIVPVLTILVENFNKIAPPVIIAATAIGTFFLVANAGTILSALKTGLLAVKGAFAALNTTMLANPIAMVVAAIAALVAAFIYLWNTSEEFRQFWIDLWEKIKEIAGVVWEAITGFFAVAWEKIKEAWGATSEFFGDLWDGIKNVFSSVGGWFSEKFQNAWNGIKNAFSTVGKFFSDLWEEIKKPFVSIADWFKEKFQNAWEGVKNVFSTGGRIFEGIKEGITGVFTTVVNGIIRGINWIIKQPFDKINDVLGFMRGLDFWGWQPFGWFETFPVPKIPELAEGGVLPKGKTGYLEGDGAEAVVPLEKNTEWTSRIAKLITTQLPQKTDTAVINKLTEIANLLDRQLENSMNLTINIENFNGNDLSNIDKLVEKIKRELYPSIYRDKIVWG